MNKKLNSALYYQSIGLSIIPTSANKKSLINWKQYQDQGATTEEINQWWITWPDANPALVTGKTSGVVALDLDKKHNRTSKEFTIPPTACAKSGNGGEHFFFKYPKNVLVKSGSAIDGEGVDSRADGGYILLAPSVNENGGKYEWVVPLDSKEDLAEMPEWFLKLVTNDHEDKKWLSGKNGVDEGKRNDTAISMAGKILSSTDFKLWEDLGWEQLKIWNEKNSKPIIEKELRSTWESAKKYQNYEKKNGGEENKGSQINKLIKIVEEKEVEYFHDEKGESYIAFELKGNRQVWPCEDSKVSSWLSFLFWENEKTALRTDTVKGMIGLFKSRAQYEGKEYSLNMRAAQMKGELWYDLVDEKWRAIKVNKDGWEIIEKPPIIFKRVIHNKKQVIPVKGGDVKLFLNYVNVKKPEEQLLLLVFLISCFIPNFPHVIAVIFGNHGSAKSSLSTLMKLVVDPSFAKVISIPKNNKELIQAFANNYFLFFDNISYISNEVSDILCRIVTGGGFIKRKLYTNNEDIVDDIRRPFGINGINLVGTRPDLLDRSLLLELDRIGDEDKKTEGELEENFEKDLPLILGGIFDTLAEVLKIESEIKIKRFTRMADFAKWGAAIAIALGYTQEEFMSIYRANIESQTQIVIDESAVAVTLVSFMKDKARWIGTASKLLHKLNDQRASDTQSLEGMFEKFWPKAPNYLIRRLNEIEPSLATIGIIFKKTPKGDRREVEIRNTKVKEEKETMRKENDDTDDTIPLIEKGFGGEDSF